MTKLIPLLQGKALLIELPEGATDPEIYGRSLTYDTPEADEWGYDYQTVKLPKGNWRIIGMLMDVSVEFEYELEVLVDECDPMHADDPFWWDYQNDCYFDESMGARDTIESAILAENWYFENPYGETKPMTFEQDAMERQLWQQAQSRVLDRSRCLLLGREA